MFCQHLFEWQLALLWFAKKEILMRTYTKKKPQKAVPAKPIDFKVTDPSIREILNELSRDEAHALMNIVLSECPLKHSSTSSKILKEKEKKKRQLK